MQTVDDARNAGESALKQARRAAKQGDLAACEKWSKNAERMALAAEKLAALPPPQDSFENEEALRAELRARLARYAEAAQENRCWEQGAGPHDLDAIMRGEGEAGAGANPHPASGSRSDPAHSGFAGRRATGGGRGSAP